MCFLWKLRNVSHTWIKLNSVVSCAVVALTTSAEIRKGVERNRKVRCVEYGFGNGSADRCRNEYDNRGTEGRRVIRSDGRYASKHRCECGRERGLPYVSWAP
jgi:capsid protein